MQMITHDCRWINTVGIKSDYSLDNPLHTTIIEYMRQGGIQYYSYIPPSKSLQSHSRSYAHITLHLLPTTSPIHPNRKQSTVSRIVLYSGAKPLNRKKVVMEEKTTPFALRTISVLQTNTPIKRQSCELPTAGDWTR